MSPYNPPIKDQLFLLAEVIGLEDIGGGLKAEDLPLILESAGELAANIIAPLQKAGDEYGARLAEDNSVKTAPGYKDAYAQYRDNGWNAVPFSEDYGGQGLSWPLAFAVQEMWQGADLSFGLCPLLNQGAVEAIENHGSAAQKETYLPHLVSGLWTGTMNLTEPQAGTDLGAITTKAVKADDGSFRITGQKIFITYGEHDLADNIIHLVLARLPDAPEGTKGISLFIVPKFIPDENGKPGARNDLKCVSLEHKLGIHGSPTCTMVFGEEGGAIGYLVGEEHAGLKYMFTMMNNARLSVGLQGVAVAERAYQAALAYARERVQGTKPGDKSGDRVPIIEHEDVRRMLLTMKALTEAGRALTYGAAASLQRARGGDSAAQGEVDLLTPIVKAWNTDMAVEVASLGIQIFGGMGFIEETGAAQCYRDARILPIYEGTNGVQAMDLTMRKILRDKGEGFKNWLADAAETVEEGQKHEAQEVKGIAAQVESALGELAQATEQMLAQGGKGDVAGIAAISVPYLQAFGYIVGGVMMARAACAASSGLSAQPENIFYRQKIKSAVFYATNILPRYKSALAVVENGAAAITDFSPALFS